MIGVVIGEKGAGKTKKLLNHANKMAAESKGSVVFVDDDNSYMFDLATSIRFINASTYNIKSSKMLYGFICGIAAQDFDLEYIYIDGFKNFIHHSLSELRPFFTSLGEVAEKNNLSVILSISGSETDLPEYIKELIMEIPN
ncbi:MAG: hypothetical protein II000_06935 [Clostridia bacterium]|nr:hypothetical protein [Clostridia bacterium]MBQ5757130.1 hypothetical protein [Clostridia bacterium]